MPKTLKSVIRHRTFLSLATLAVLWGAFTLYQQWVAPTRLDPALRQAMTKEETIGSIAVDLNFVPEDFHINYLQQYGIVAGVNGKTIMLVQVSRDEIRQLSELYWVKSIRLVSP